MNPDFSAFEAKAAGMTDAVIAVASAHDPEVLEAILEAHDAFGAAALLIGDTKRMLELVPSLDGIPGMALLDAPDDESAAAMAVDACRSGKANVLMKGHLQTATLMRAVVNRQTGLRGDRLLSHVMFLAPPSYHKLIALTDGGLNTFPDLNQKKAILENALTLLQTLGVSPIYVSVIAAAEQVNPKIQTMVDAAALAAMPEWEQYNAKVIGPVALDLAISETAVKVKHYAGEGAGHADLLLVPNYEVGNGIGKAMTWIGGAESAGVIVGATVPIVVVSRSDDSTAKRRSIAIALAARANGKEVLN